MITQPLDREALRDQVRNAQPFPHLKIDGFLEPSFAERCAASFPSYEEAQRMGFEFSAINENRKVQITDSCKFPDPIKQLHAALADPAFLDLLSYVFQIPGLLADPDLRGGGIHETGPRGHLDVHVDFNYVKDKDWHRRLNILLYLNKEWKPEWGGHVELWDQDVKVCHHSFAPIFNRCVIFETSEISYHGVTAVRCPPDYSRKSFAAYYYTKVAPPGWDGTTHSTLFKARPNEWFKGRVLMPADRFGRRVLRGIGADQMARGALRKLRNARHRSNSS